jgi:hypothetical protein
VLEGVYAGTDHHIFAIVATAQPGIIFAVSLLTSVFSRHCNNIAAQLE